VEQETAASKKGVVVDVAPLEGVAKVWCKKRLLRRKVWQEMWLPWIDLEALSA
jgi:hypothetical protein